jgi:hypothetical protein
VSSHSLLIQFLGECLEKRIGEILCTYPLINWASTLDWGLLSSGYRLCWLRLFTISSTPLGDCHNTALKLVLTSQLPVIPMS